jgi:diguanylate cyclase (GGDEF)-like protein
MKLIGLQGIEPRRTWCWRAKQGEIMFRKALPAIAVLYALAPALPAPAWGQARPPTEIAPLDATSNEAERAEALQAFDDWLTRDFEAARPAVVEAFNNAALPAEYRSRLLRKAIAKARTASKLDLEEEAGPAYRALVEALPAGAERSALHQTYGNLNLWRGRFEAAEALYRKAAADNPSADAALRASLKSSLGVALAQQGKLDEALGTMLDAYRLFEQTDSGPSPQLLRNIGGLSIYLEDWEQAVTFSRLAIDKSPPDAPQLSGIYSNLAAALIEQGNLEPALEALQKGLAIDEARGEPRSAVISNMGYVLRELGRTQEALRHFRRAAEVDRSNDDTGSLAITLKNVGETLIQLDRRQEADRVLQESMAAYREADIKPKRLELYPVLVENLEQLQRYPEALALMREYRALTEELASADAQTRVAELQTAFDLERKERELAESERVRLAGEARLATLESAQTRQRHLRTLLITGVVALALILLLLLRLLQLRTRANRLLAEKNAEIDRQHKALGETNAKLQRQSIEDELTGLGNRRSIRQLIESGPPAALSDRPALLVLVDLDRFKGINDTFGHPVGDYVLTVFARVLRDVAAPDDVLARWGGEEFLWLIADAQIADASARCRALSDRLRSTRFEASGRSLSITCSMGVATVHLGTADPEAAFDESVKIADAALYEAKDAGRDSWIGFERRVDDPKAFKGPLDVEALIERGALVRNRLQDRR